MGVLSWPSSRFCTFCPSNNEKSILSYISAKNADMLIKVMSIPMFSRARKRINPFMKCCLLIMHHFYANLFRHWWKSIFCYISEGNATILMNMLSTPMFSRARKTISPFMKGCLLIMHHCNANLFRHWWKINFLLYLGEKCKYFNEYAVYTHIFMVKEDNEPIYIMLVHDHTPFYANISAISEKEFFCYI